MSKISKKAVGGSERTSDNLSITRKEKKISLKNISNEDNVVINV